ncbi:MAG: hypothetical protein K5981_09535 [Clostridia bacterium]|nr:hypothetical protein [Clostridia bacterium]
MKGKDLFNAMGYIDDDLAGEALDAGLGEASGASGAKQARARVRTRSRSWTKWGALAACLALAVIGGLFANGRMGSGKASAPMMAAQNAKDADLAMEAAPAEAAPESVEEPMDYDAATEGMYYAADGAKYAGVDGAEAEEAKNDAQIETETAAAEAPATSAAAAEEMPEAEPGEGPAAGAHLPNMPYGQDLADYTVRKMISGFHTAYESSYAMPQNGEVGLSLPLRDAMDAFRGEDVLYRVVVEIFRDAGKPAMGHQPDDSAHEEVDESERLLDPDSAEAQDVMARLARDYGFITAIETFTDADGSQTTWNTLHATYEQLADFPKDPEHGFMLWLYDEIVR